MDDLSSLSLGRQARRLRLDTLVRLRWLAVIGQTGAVTGTYFGLGFTLPLASTSLMILLSGCVNLGLRLRYPVSLRLNDVSAFLLLAYDIAQLSILLFLTGGLQNPFSMLFLAPIMISAASLPARLTVGLGSLMVLSVSLLVFFHQPLPWYPGQRLDLPFLYIAGVWLAVVLGAGFIAIYSGRVAEESRQLADALAATELVLTREQHLSQLDGLAAAAAHELGTPLATMTIVIKEMALHLPKDSALLEDVELLRQEAARCKMILGKLNSLGQEGSGPMEQMTLEHLLEEVVAPQRDFGVKMQIVARGEGPMPMCRRNSGVVYGLGNLIENAIDFANTEVNVLCSWSAHRVKVAIVDDGPGFAADVLGRIGEPYLSPRNASRRAKNDEGDGLGLGLFIAKSLLERSGAQVSVSNRTNGTGAQVEISWARLQFEAIRA
eukprot:gene9450-9530_t